MTLAKSSPTSPRVKGGDRGGHEAPHTHQKLPPAPRVFVILPVNVDPHCENRQNYQVQCTDDHVSVVLTRHSTRKNASFVIIQALESTDGSHFGTFVRWGEVGEVGKGKLDTFNSRPESMKKFNEMFEAVTGNHWRGSVLATLSHFEFVLGKYVLLSRTSTLELLGIEYGACAGSPSAPKGKGSTRAEAAEDKNGSKSTRTVAKTAGKEGVEQKKGKPQKAQPKGNGETGAGDQRDGTTSSKEEHPPVDEMVKEREGYEVVVDDDGPWCAVLTKMKGAKADSSNAFMILQMLQTSTPGISLTATVGKAAMHFYCFSRWGWINSTGENVMQGFETFDEAKQEFERQHFEASGNAWKGSLNATLRTFKARPDKFTLLERTKWADVISSCSASAAKHESTSEECDVQTPRVTPSPKGSAADPEGGKAAKSSRSQRSRAKSERAPDESADEEEDPNGSKTPTPVAEVNAAQSTPSSKKPSTTKDTKAEAKAPTDSVDEHVENADDYTVHWAVKLSQTKAKGKFYILQLLEKRDQSEYCVFVRSGRVGTTGGFVSKSLPSLRQARKAFERKFEEKTKNKWSGDLPSTTAKFVAVTDDPEMFVIQAH